MSTTILARQSTCCNANYADGAQRYAHVLAECFAHTIADMVRERNSDRDGYDFVSVPLTDVRARLLGEGWTPSQIDDSLMVALSRDNEHSEPMVSIVADWHGEAWAPSLQVCGKIKDWLEESDLQHAAEQARREGAA